MHKKRLLIVEDEESLRKGMTLNLELEGYDVVPCDHGKEAIKLIKQQHFDVIVLDVMLPEIDGFQICEQIRLEGLTTPVIFVTAKGDGVDRIEGLKKGADDYLTKPFHLEELLLRVKNLIKRSQLPMNLNLTTYDFGPNSVNFNTYEAKNKEGSFRLTKKEVMLLKLLIERKNEVVAREQILQAVWGYDIYPSTRTIDNFILALRKYFEENHKEPKYITSVRGVGYKFNDVQDQT